jgi:hypothetical protein
MAARSTNVCAGSAVGSKYAAARERFTVVSTEQCLG